MQESRNGKDEPRCAPEMRNVTSTLPPFFDWLQFATYEGQEKVREMSYDHWGLTVSGLPNYIGYVYTSTCASA